jgi:hypothetical protein
MEICVDIDEELLCEFDRVARDHDITRSIAVRQAITAWLSQARRDMALRELFDMGSDAESSGGDRSEKSSAPPKKRYPIEGVDNTCETRLPRSEHAVGCLTGVQARCVVRSSRATSLGYP